MSTTITARIGKGGVQSTWDMIYSSRRKILYAGPEEDTASMWKKIRGASTTNSDTILQTLIEKGRLPGYALGNSLCEPSWVKAKHRYVAPFFRGLEVHDNGNNIELRVRLPKGDNIQKVLEILGGGLQGYVDWEKLNTDDPDVDAQRIAEELQDRVTRARMAAMAGNRALAGPRENGSNLLRALGLWLWDRSKTHPDEGREKSKRSLYAAHPSLKDNLDENHLFRYRDNADACIAAGKFLPITVK